VTDAWRKSPPIGFAKLLAGGIPSVSLSIEAMPEAGGRSAGETFASSSGASEAPAPILTHFAASTANLLGIDAGFNTLLHGGSHVMGEGLLSISPWEIGGRRSSKGLGSPGDSTTGAEHC